MRGRSTFARLALAGYDARGRMAIGPVVQWAKAAWDSSGAQGRHEGLMESSYD